MREVKVGIKVTVTFTTDELNGGTFSNYVFSSDGGGKGTEAVLEQIEVKIGETRVSEMKKSGPNTATIDVPTDV